LKTKKRDLLNRYIPLWSIAPLVTIMAVNCLIYWGSSALTAGRYHFDFTMAFDREVPLLPVFVWFYILAFPFWAVGYLLAARRGKDMFYRFVATDLTIHFICFICFYFNTDHQYKTGDRRKYPFGKASRSGIFPGWREQSF